MAAGAIFINASARNQRVFHILEPLTPPLYALFFVIAGTELQPGIMLQKPVLVLGSIFIVARAIGKYGGVWLGCFISRTSLLTQNYLGFCMLPQAGVAIGLVLLIQASPTLAGLSPEQQAIVDLETELQ